MISTVKSKNKFIAGILALLCLPVWYGIYLGLDSAIASEDSTTNTLIGAVGLIGALISVGVYRLYLDQVVKYGKYLVTGFVFSIIYFCIALFGSGDVTPETLDAGLTNSFFFMALVPYVLAVIDGIFFLSQPDEKFVETDADGFYAYFNKVFRNYDFGLVNYNKKNKYIAGALALISGPIALHRFYLQQFGKGVSYILTSVLAFIVPTLILSAISGEMSAVEVPYECMNGETYNLLLFLPIVIIWALSVIDAFVYFIQPKKNFINTEAGGYLAMRRLEDIGKVRFFLMIPIFLAYIYLIKVSVYDLMSQYSSFDFDAAQKMVGEKPYYEIINDPALITLVDYIKGWWNDTIQAFVFIGAYLFFLFLIFPKQFAGRLVFAGVIPFIIFITAALIMSDTLNVYTKIGLYEDEQTIQDKKEAKYSKYEIFEIQKNLGTINWRGLEDFSEPRKLTSQELSDLINFTYGTLKDCEKDEILSKYFPSRTEIEEIKVMRDTLNPQRCYREKYLVSIPNDTIISADTTGSMDPNGNFIVDSITIDTVVMTSVIPNYTNILIEEKKDTITVPIDADLEWLTESVKLWVEEFESNSGIKVRFVTDKNESLVAGENEIVIDMTPKNQARLKDIVFYSSVTDTNQVPAKDSVIIINDHNINFKKLADNAPRVKERIYIRSEIVDSNEFYDDRIKLRDKIFVQQYRKDTCITDTLYNDGDYEMVEANLEELVKSWIGQTENSWRSCDAFAFNDNKEREYLFNKENGIDSAHVFIAVDTTIIRKDTILIADTNIYKGILEDTILTVYNESSYSSDLLNWCENITVKDSRDPKQVEKFESDDTNLIGLKYIVLSQEFDITIDSMIAVPDSVAINWLNHKMIAFRDKNRINKIEDFKEFFDYYDSKDVYDKQERGLAIIEKFPVLQAKFAELVQKKRDAYAKFDAGDDSEEVTEAMYSDPVKSTFEWIPTWIDGLVTKVQDNAEIYDSKDMLLLLSIVLLIAAIIPLYLFGITHIVHNIKGSIAILLGIILAILIVKAVMVNSSDDIPGDIVKNQELYDQTFKRFDRCDISNFENEELRDSIFVSKPIVKENNEEVEVSMLKKYKKMYENMNYSEISDLMHETDTEVNLTVLLLILSLVAIVVLEVFDIIKS
jgi:TM2 domain-containing membrane protein YozV